MNTYSPSNKKARFPLVLVILLAGLVVCLIGFAAVAVWSQVRPVMPAL